MWRTSESTMIHPIKLTVTVSADRRSIVIMIAAGSSCWLFGVTLMRLNRVIGLDFTSCPSGQRCVKSTMIYSTWYPTARRWSIHRRPTNSLNYSQLHGYEVSLERASDRAKMNNEAELIRSQSNHPACVEMEPSHQVMIRAATWPLFS